MTPTDFLHQSVVLWVVCSLHVARLACVLKSVNSECVNVQFNLQELSAMQEIK